MGWWIGCIKSLGFGSLLWHPWDMFPISMFQAMLQPSYPCSFWAAKCGRRIRRNKRQQKSSFLCRKTLRNCPVTYLIGQNLVTWLYLAEREAGKFRLYPKQPCVHLKVEVLLLQKCIRIDNQQSMPQLFDSYLTFQCA